MWSQNRASLSVFSTWYNTVVKHEDYTTLVKFLLIHEKNRSSEVNTVILFPPLKLDNEETRTYSTSISIIQNSANINLWPVFEQLCFVLEKNAFLGMEIWLINVRERSPWSSRGSNGMDGSRRQKEGLYKIRGQSLRMQLERLT